MSAAPNRKVGNESDESKSWCRFSWSSDDCLHCPEIDWLYRLVMVVGVVTDLDSGSYHDCDSSVLILSCFL